VPVPITPPLFVVEAVRFAAGPYHLEGRLAYPEESASCGVAVIAGPHPYLGGDQDNNVVRAVGDGLASLGYVTLRFNYRGVGRSEGPAIDRTAQFAEFWQTSHAAGELDGRLDLEGAVTFARQTAPAELPLVLVGYSFGCVLLPHITKCAARVLLAPTVSKHDYGVYREVMEPLLIVVSEDDFATPASVVAPWFEALPGRKQLVRRASDNHFFRGHETWLVDTTAAFLAKIRED
jgi:uncharacterized protein